MQRSTFLVKSQAINHNFVEKINLSKVFFNWFFHTLETPPMTSERKKKTIQFNVYYIA